MKLKQDPEDFQVEELTDIVPAQQGPFAYYRLAKRGWTTPDALQAIRRRWKVDLNRLSYGGLKDRHAHTIQYLTIFHGPQRRLTHHGIQLEYLGQVSQPYRSADIRGNRFTVTLRAMGAFETAAAEEALAQVRLEGVPNYFDDQRFGSVSQGGQFVAEALLRGEYEEGLRRALLMPYEFDRAAQKQEKAILGAHWGDWGSCKEQLPRSHARSLVDYLVGHPGDFRGAVARLRPELRGLYLSAYQSYLWNKMLDRWLRRHCRPEQMVDVPLRLGDVAMHRGLDDAQLADLGSLRLPLPSARTHADLADPAMILLQNILEEEGLEIAQFKLKGLRDMFFSRGDRAALCLPLALRHETSADERHADRKKIVLSFELGRGSYATLLVKRITSAHLPSAG